MNLIKKILFGLVLASFLLLPLIGLVAREVPPPAAAPLPCRALERHDCDRRIDCWWHEKLPERETRHCLPFRPMPRVDLIPGILRVVDIIFTILVAAAVIFVMIGAFQLLTAGGDAEKVSQGREKILYAVIAVVVALLARGIIEFIRRAF